MNILLAQTAPSVGALQANLAEILAVIQEHPEADVLVFPELALCGYPPEDLLLRPKFLARLQENLQTLCAASAAKPHQAWLIGGVDFCEEGLYNAAYWISAGQIQGIYHKQALPNYGVFDEKRYFLPGNQHQASQIIVFQGQKIALGICEDVWDGDWARRLASHQPQWILSLHASPFERGKLAHRLAVAKRLCQTTGANLVYVNQVGGQDELIFDGGSFVMTPQALVAMAPQFESCQMVLDCQNLSPLDFIPSEEIAQVYQALCLGIRDYVRKNGFNRVVLGLSGGIDSALVLCLAVDALGADAVEAVMMPFKYTSQMSLDDAQAQAQKLGVRYQVISIESSFAAMEAALSSRFAQYAADVTEENLQSRLRGVMLMAISNKTGAMVLPTGNKSEMAVGYATLYGDMVGGYAPLKDVPKTSVYALAHWRNAISQVIPQSVIDRPPSAELAPGQVDQDSLPEYDTLDALIYALVDERQSSEDLIAQGFAADVVLRVARLIKINEYKRRQSAPGPKISKRLFGRERRYPISSGFDF